MEKMTKNYKLLEKKEKITKYYKILHKITKKGNFCTPLIICMKITIYR